MLDTCSTWFIAVRVLQFIRDATKIEQNLTGAPFSVALIAEHGYRHIQQPAMAATRFTREYSNKVPWHSWARGLLADRTLGELIVSSEKVNKTMNWKVIVREEFP